MNKRDQVEELAQSWWRNRSPGGLFDLTHPLEPAEADAAMESENRVWAMVREPSTLSEIFEKIVQNCPTDSELPYIGASIVEEAEEAIGPRAIQILQQSSIDDTTMRKVMSGYWSPG